MRTKKNKNKNKKIKKQIDTMTSISSPWLRRIKKSMVFRDRRGKELFTVNLIDGKSFIFINGERFMTCRFVPIAIPAEDMPKFKQIESINDIIDHLDFTLEREPPERINGEDVGELDFFVNCSNLQAWVEHDFDTRLLDYRLSYPLLKALGEINSRARMRYREELLERLKASTNQNLWGYLNGLIDSEFEWQEKLDFLLPREREILEELVEKYNLPILSNPALYRVEFDFRTGTISKLRLFSNSQIKSSGLPSCLRELKGIKELDLMSDNLSTLPKWLKELTTLRNLKIGKNPLKSLPVWFSEMVSLEDLHLIYTDLEALPDNFGDLCNLKDLCLNYNNLKGLPESFRKLQNLKVLDMTGCDLTSFPEQVLSLRALEKLELNKNELSELPDLSHCLPNLKTINLSANKLCEVPEWLLHHPSLEHVALSENSISSIPEMYTESIPLRFLALRENKFTEFPASLLYIPSLKDIVLDGNQIADFPDIEALPRQVEDYKKIDLKGNPLNARSEALHARYYQLFNNFGLPKWITRKVKK